LREAQRELLALAQLTGRRRSDNIGMDEAKQRVLMIESAKQLCIQVGDEAVAKQIAELFADRLFDGGDLILDRLQQRLVGLLRGFVGELFVLAGDLDLAVDPATGHVLPAAPAAGDAAASGGGSL